MAFSKPVRVSGEEFGIKHSHHRGAGTRGAHHIVRIVKKVEDLRSQHSSFITVTRVEGRLAATGLRRIESDLDIQPTKHVDHTLTHLGEELVTQTSYKERDSSSGHFNTRKALTVLEKRFEVKDQRLARLREGSVVISDGRSTRVRKLNEVPGFMEWKNPSPALLRRAPQGRGLYFQLGRPRYPPKDVGHAQPPGRASFS